MSLRFKAPNFGWHYFICIPPAGFGILKSESLFTFDSTVTKINSHFQVSNANCKVYSKVAVVLKSI